MLFPWVLLCGRAGFFLPHLRRAAGQAASLALHSDSCRPPFLVRSRVAPRDDIPGRCLARTPAPPAEKSWLHFAPAGGAALGIGQPKHGPWRGLYHTARPPDPSLGNCSIARGACPQCAPRSRPSASRRRPGPSRDAVQGLPGEQRARSRDQRRDGPVAQRRGCACAEPTPKCARLQATWAEHDFGGRRPHSVVVGGTMLLP